MVSGQWSADYFDSRLWVGRNCWWWNRFGRAGHAVKLYMQVALYSQKPIVLRKNVAHDWPCNEISTTNEQATRHKRLSLSRKAD